MAKITKENPVWSDATGKNLITFGDYSVVLNGSGWKDLGVEGFHSFCDLGNVVTILDNVTNDIVFTLSVENNGGKHELILTQSAKMSLKAK